MPSELPTEFIYPFQRICQDCPDTTVGGDITVDEGGHTEFPTVAAMLSAPSGPWTSATVWNYEGSDGNWSTWIQTDSPALSINGIDVLQTDDGQKVVRTFVLIP